jgi:hypothetical protein
VPSSSDLFFPANTAAGYLLADVGGPRLRPLKDNGEWIALRIFRGEMSELITDLNYRIVDEAGGEYYVSAAGELGQDGRWDGWLEFVPTDDSAVLITATETQQSTRADLAHWATTLTDVYLEGAFARATPVSDDSLSTRVVARVMAADAVGAPAAIDPFEVMSYGKEVLRATLRPLTRTQLLSIIANYGLNPAGKSLAWLSHSQLITFIATAVEAQLLQGKR